MSLVVDIKNKLRPPTFSIGYRFTFHRVFDELSIDYELRAITLNGSNCVILFDPIFSCNHASAVDLRSVFGNLWMTLSTT